MDIVEWLRGFGFTRYERAFRANAIDSRKKIYRTFDELHVDLDACWSTTIIGDRLKAAGALARPRCRLFLTHSPWPRRNSWPLDHR